MHTLWVNTAYKVKGQEQTHSHKVQYLHQVEEKKLTIVTFQATSTHVKGPVSVTKHIRCGSTEVPVWGCACMCACNYEYVCKFHITELKLLASSLCLLKDHTEGKIMRQM